MNETLYILMRNDMDSLNPGKAMAQACHAANAFIHTVNKGYTDQFMINDESQHSVRNWANQTNQGFGTTITLAGNIADITQTIIELNSFNKKITNSITKSFGELILDPTYPLLDGVTLHLIPVITCAYIFAPDRTDSKIMDLLSKYHLHP